MQRQEAINAGGRNTQKQERKTLQVCERQRKIAGREEEEEEGEGKKGKERRRLPPEPRGTRREEKVFSDVYKLRCLGGMREEEERKTKKADSRSSGEV